MNTSVRLNQKFLYRLILAASMALALNACSSAQKKDGLPDEGSTATTENAGGSSDDGSAGGLVTINFDYDTFNLTEKSKKQLSDNAALLKKNASWIIQIEGHCDERGGVQYNLALGDKRAVAAQRYLQDNGIAKERLNVISFGKEKPIALGTSEEAFGKNRRANFVITSK